jgi:hypothetical protein
MQCGLAESLSRNLCQFFLATAYLRRSPRSPWLPSVVTWFMPPADTRDAGDGSAYSAQHVINHPLLPAAATSFGFSTSKSGRIVEVDQARRAVASGESQADGWGTDPLADIRCADAAHAAATGGLRDGPGA